MIRIVQTWRDASLWFKGLALGLLPAAVLLVSTVIGYRLHVRVDHADAELRRVYSVQSDIEALHILLAEASLALRGYALTGRKDYLQPMHRSQAGAKHLLQQMRQLIRDPEVLALHASVSAHFDAHFQDLKRLQTTIDSGDGQATLSPLIDRSKASFDVLRRELGMMHTREAELVTGFSRTARQATEQSYRFTLIASLAAIAISATSLTLLLGGILGRVRKLAGNSERLLCDQPLEPIHGSRDELGVVAERLQNASQLLAERAMQARQANEAKSRFLSRTSHEFRTPLNAIIGHAQLLQESTTDAVTTAAQRIEQAAQHLLQLINDLLDVSTLESSQLRVAIQPIDASALIREVLRLMAPLAQQQAVTLTASDTEPLKVLADPQRLRQILLNLVANAIKFNRVGGSVALSWRIDEQHGVISVRDTGRGIQTQYLSRLFKPLDRLDAEDLGITGNGLGLALSHQLAIAMGGSLNVSSKIDHGSEFSVTPTSPRVQ